MCEEWAKTFTREVIVRIIRGKIKPIMLDLTLSTQTKLTMTTSEPRKIFLFFEITYTNYNSQKETIHFNLHLT